MLGDSMSYCRVYRNFCQISFCTKVVILTSLLWKPSRRLFHLVCCLPVSYGYLWYSAHCLTVWWHHAEYPHIMQHILSSCVSPRIRDSAKDTSSGTEGLRWWHTIIMSRCSASVFVVNGLVGFVDDGKIFFSPAIFIMSGAWPPPAPSVWYVWIVLPAMACIVSSTKPHSFNVSVWIATWVSVLSVHAMQNQLWLG